MCGMCGVCCEELRRWGRSFTKTEAFLSVLEAALFITFIALLTFVVLHFLACSKKDLDSVVIPPPSEASGGGFIDTTADSDKGVGVITGVDDQSRYTPIYGEGPPSSQRPTVAPGKCTWKPGMKTDAVTHYFEQTGITELKGNTILTETTEMLPLSDGEEAEKSYKRHVLALVKIRPPQDITFGCILTIVEQRWAVTAASCIEAIEEVDSLDSFVMMEDYGESTNGKTHSVADVLIHPWYEGKNKSYDIVVLKSEDSLVEGSKVKVELPSALDYFLMTIGERFTMLGYGGYRTVDQSPSGRRLRSVSSFALSPSQCGAALQARDAWSPRHLSRPHSAPHAACGARALCGGALAARGTACNYCGGTPLLRGATLVGLMSDNPQCGVACEPALFVNVALLRPWLEAQLGGDDEFIA